MNSKVTKLLDYKQVEVPEKLCLWRVTDQAMEEQLHTLSLSHAMERDVDEVSLWDSVVCKGESTVSRWNKPVLLFYPGHNLCEKGIEDALVGMKRGESKTVSAREGEVTLTVSRIVRREAHPVDDELVKLEQVEGVETLEGYCRWYRETTEAEDHRRNRAYLARHLLQEIEKGSECEIDEAEETAYAEEFAEVLRKSDEARGIDPTVPEEGTEFLTEEQVKEKYISMSRPLFRNQIVDAAVAEMFSGQDAETLFQEGLREMAEKYYHMDVETMLKEFQVSETIMRNQVFFAKAEELLKEHCDELMEE